MHKVDRRLEVNNDDVYRRSVLFNSTIGAGTLHQLRVFAFIVEQGSVSGAAKALGITKSVASGHLKHLEEELNVRLLERTTRSMSLTTIGEEVFRFASKMLENAEDAVQAARADNTSVRGLLRVSCPNDLDSVILPALRQLRRQHPLLRVQVVVGDRPVDIITNRIDVALRVGIPEDSEFIIRKLCTIEEHVYASPAFAKEWRKKSRPDHLLEAPWIQHEIVYGQKMSFYNTKTHETLRLSWPNPVLALSSARLMRSLAEGGEGFTVLPEIMAIEAVEQGRLKRIAAPWIRRELLLYTLMPSKTQSLKRRAFFEALQQSISDLGCL